MLAIVSEVYNRNAHPGADLTEGRRRLEAKVERINAVADPEFRIADYGTRRRFSRAWHEEVLRTLKPPASARSSSARATCKFAQEQGLTPLGTMAHEYLQACQAVGPRLRDSQVFAFNTWAREYRGDLGIALSDVCGMDAFLRDFDLFFCKLFDGVRHDSGDPFEWGEKLIAHYQKMRIDPHTKTMVFSDSLNVPLAIRLFEHFRGRMHTAFGIGTNLTNDLGFEPLSIVIKMTRCNGQPVAKISDEPSKTMDYDPSYVAYLREVFEVPEATAPSPAGLTRRLRGGATCRAAVLACRVLPWLPPLPAYLHLPATNPPNGGRGRSLRLDEILTLLVADGLVAAADADTLARSRDAPPRPPAGDHRRAGLACGERAAPGADARLAGRVARRQARRPLSAHRSAEDRSHRGHAVDDQRLCRALPDPAGRGDAARR